MGEPCEKKHCRHIAYNLACSCGYNHFMACQHTFNSLTECRYPSHISYKYKKAYKREQQSIVNFPQNLPVRRHNRHSRKCSSQSRGNNLSQGAKADSENAYIHPKPEVRPEFFLGFPLEHHISFFTQHAASSKQYQGQNHIWACEPDKLPRHHSGFKIQIDILRISHGCQHASHIGRHSLQYSYRHYHLVKACQLKCNNRKWHKGYQGHIVSYKHGRKEAQKHHDHLYTSAGPYP